jgi:hypothetical protein
MSAAISADHWREQLRPLFAGRKVIIKVELIVHATPMVAAVRDLGATDVFVLATSGPGTGPGPAEDQAQVLSLDARGDGLLGAIRESVRIVGALPRHARDALDRFDPDRDALVVGDFLTESPTLDGRPFLAHRRPEWLALDDKTVVDGLWDRAGIDRAPSEVVDAELPALRAAAARLDRGMGTVWAADSTDGWHGGAERVRWVRDDHSATEAATSLEQWATTVRVMPFLDGIPCSIHGIVFDDDVVTLRPAEMIVLRTTGDRFFYAGCASFFDPPDADREAMRATARTVGAQLREEVAYRGAFTIDGVLTTDGFRPTELNPRNGAALNMMVSKSTDGLPFQLVLDAVVAGIEADWRTRELEELLLERADAQRAGGTGRVVPLVDDAPEPIRIAVDEAPDGSAARAAVEDEPAVGTMVVGPNPAGSYVMLSFDPSVVAAGPSVAPLALAFWRFADARLGLGLGAAAMSCAEVVAAGSAGR